MTTRKLLPPNLRIEEMLKRKTLEQMLKDGDVYTAEDAAPIMGYHHISLLKLCREGRIERIEFPGRKRKWYLYARTVHGSQPHHVAPSAERRAA